MSLVYSLISLYTIRLFASYAHPKMEDPQSDSDIEDKTEVTLDDEPDQPAWSNLSWGQWDDGKPVVQPARSLHISALSDDDDDEELEDDPEKGIKEHKNHTGRRHSAMQHLKQIVGTRNLNQRIKRVKGVNTVAGANEWLRKRGLDKQGYTVKAKDIDNDGIADIIIRTKKGHMAVVNGYTVRPSDFAYRQLFDQLTPEQRQGANDYKTYFRDIVYKTDYGPDGEPIYGGITPGSEDDVFGRKLAKRRLRPYMPRRRSPYQTFTSLANELFNNAVNDGVKQLLTPQGKHPQSAWMKAIAHVWTFGIIAGELESLGMKHVRRYLTRNPQAFPKTRSSDKFKNDIAQAVTFMANNPNDSEVKRLQHDLLETAIRFTAEYNREHNA